jgi:hypothetical protein
VLPRADHGVGDLQPIKKTAALLADVEARDVAQTEFALKHRSRSRHVEVGGHGGEDDVVDVAPVDTGLGDRLLRGGDRQIARRLLQAGVAPCDDAGPAADPGVGRLHETGQTVVVDDVGGDVHPRSPDDRAHRDSPLTVVDFPPIAPRRQMNDRPAAGSDGRVSAGAARMGGTSRDRGRPSPRTRPRAVS